jgi:hypothetical protein
VAHDQNEKIEGEGEHIAKQPDDLIVLRQLKYANYFFFPSTI